MYSKLLMMMERGARGVGQCGPAVAETTTSEAKQALLEISNRALCASEAYCLCKIFGGLACVCQRVSEQGGDMGTTMVQNGTEASQKKEILVAQTGSNQGLAGLG
jgi:hypothetical protein